MPKEIELKKGRAPSFQLFPDKALAGSDHLTAPSFKAYWKLLWWMWLHAPDYCSMPDTDAAWHTATGVNGKTLKKVRAEIMQEHMPLLKRIKGKTDRLISEGLKKEAQKQKKRRQQQSAAAKSRWHKDLKGMRAHRQPDADEPSSAPDSVEFSKAHPEYKKLIQDPQLRGITPEQYLSILRFHPKADEARAVQKALDTAPLMTSGIDHPALFLRKQFSKNEQGRTGGDTRRSSLPASKKKPAKKKDTPF